MRGEIRPLLGPERTAGMFPFASLARSKAVLAVGSDWPVTTADPRAILDAAITRLDPGVRGARPLGPVSERLKPDVALRAYTRGSAFASRTDDVSGTIEVGKSADLVLLDGDPLQTPDVPWRDINVLLTMVDGRVVYEAPGARG